MLRDSSWKGPSLTGDELLPYSGGFEYSVLKGLGVVSVVTGWPDGWVEGIITPAGVVPGDDQLGMHLTLEVEGCLRAVFAPKARLWLAGDLFLMFTGSTGGRPGRYGYDGIAVHRFDINDPGCFGRVFGFLGVG